MMKALIQRAGRWRRWSQGQKRGPEMRSRESQLQWEEQLLENACLETDFIKPRDEFRAEFVLQILHLGWKRRNTNRLIKVMFS